MATEKPKTKECPDCDQVIGESEAICPKCGWEFETMTEETLAQMDRAVRVLNKRREKEAARLKAEEDKNKPAKKKSFFETLGKVTEK